MAADTSAVHSILVHKSNEDKIMVLDSHKLVAASGEPGDRFFISIRTNLVVFSLILLLFVNYVLPSCDGIGFSSRSIYRRMWLCISFAMVSL